MTDGRGTAHAVVPVAAEDEEPAIVQTHAQHPVFGQGVIMWSRSQQTEFEKLVTKAIILSHLPFSVLDTNEWSAVFNHLNTAAVVPSPVSISEELLDDH